MTEREGFSADVTGRPVVTWVGALLGLAAAAVAIRCGPADPEPGRRVAWIGVSFLAFGTGAWCLLRLPVRRAVPLLLLGGMLLQLAAASGPPRSSDDLYRYVWDGRVQTAGIDPYRYPPAASELAALRDPFLWPARSNWCVPPSTVDVRTGEVLLPGCTLINRPAVPTIYPPVAEALFAAVAVISPAGSGYIPIRVMAILAGLAATALLVSGLRRLGHDPRRAVLWAWCPTMAVETASNAHIDVVGALLTVAALLTLAAARSRRPVALGGILLGLAVATKLTPALVLPSVLRRRPLTALAAAAAAVVTVYLPHLLAVGTGVIGYLPGYLREEGYDSGARFGLLTLVAPDRWAGLMAVAILAATALWVLRHTDPDQPWRAAATTAGVALLVTTPTYPWYAVLLVALVALGGSASWLTVAAAGYLGQYQHELGIDRIAGERLGYGAALAVVVISAGLTRWQRGRTTAPYDTAVPTVLVADPRPL